MAILCFGKISEAVNDMANEVAGLQYLGGTIFLGLVTILFSSAYSCVAPRGPVTFRSALVQQACRDSTSSRRALTCESWQDSPDRRQNLEKSFASLGLVRFTQFSDFHSKPASLNVANSA